MPQLGAQHPVDGRQSHLILAIEDRYDGLTIVIAPRHVSLLAGLAACALLFVGAAALLMVLAFGVTTSEAWPLPRRITGGAVFAFWLSIIFGFFVYQLRRTLNYRTVTITAGLITLSSGPIWPRRQTLQLQPRDGMRVAFREGYYSPWGGKPMREYRIFASGTRGKSDWDVEVIPSFTFSEQEANKLATLMQKFANPHTEEALLNSRL